MVQSKSKIKILITGAAGYLGKNTVLFLKKDKRFKLILIDHKNKPNISFFKTITIMLHSMGTFITNCSNIIMYTSI